MANEKKISVNIADETHVDSAWDQERSACAQHMGTSSVKTQCVFAARWRSPWMQRMGQRTAVARGLHGTMRAANLAASRLVLAADWFD